MYNTDVTGVSDSPDRMTPQSLAPKDQMEKMTPLVNICKAAPKLLWG